MKNILFIVCASFLFFSCARYYPMQATSNAVAKKRGKACSSYFLGFHTGGKNHVYNAAMSRKIKSVATVDRSVSGLWPIFWKECTYVSGE